MAEAGFVGEEVRKHVPLCGAGVGLLLRGDGVAVEDPHPRPAAGAGPDDHVLVRGAAEVTGGDVAAAALGLLEGEEVREDGAVADERAIERGRLHADGKSR